MKARCYSLTAASARNSLIRADARNRVAGVYAGAKIAAKERMTCMRTSVGDPNGRIQSRGKEGSGKRWALRVVGSSIVLVAILFVAGAIYQSCEVWRDRKLNPPPGRLIDVGGYRMHIDCLGQSSQGSPTVVLDSGLGDTWLAWYKVQPAIAHYARVCSYDRAGMGWSDPSTRPRTSQVIAEELHTLLHNANIAPPYIMVGHSFGGFDVRMYRTSYPAEVVGMVLLDATHPDEYKRFPSELQKSNADFLRKETLKRDLMPLGIPRIMGWCGSGAQEIRSMLRTVDCRSGPWHEHLSEWKDWDVSASQVRACAALGDLPLVVISRDPSFGVSSDYDRRLSEVWSSLQTDLAALSTHSSHVIATGSGHMIQVDRPDLVTSAIHRMVSDYVSAASAKQKVAKP